MGLIDWAVAIGIFLFVFFFSYTTFMQRSQVRTDVFEVKSILFDFYQKILNSFGSPLNWSSFDWEEIGLISNIYRIPISVREKAGIERENEVVDIHLIFDEDCENKAFIDSFRLIKNGIEIPFDFYNETFCSTNYLKEANLVFFINSSANSTEFYYLYFSPDEEIDGVNYSSDLIYSSYLENSKIRLNLTAEISEIYNLQTFSSNILAGRKLGIVQYNSTLGIRESNDIGSKNLIINSSFIKVVELNGSNDWFDYKMNVTLYAFQPYFKLRTWIKEKLDIELQDFKNPEAYLANLYGNVGYRNETGYYTSSSTFGNVENAYYIAPFNSTSPQDSIALLTLNYSTWAEAGWNNSGKDFSFSHILNEYDTNTTQVFQNQEFLSNEIFIFPFKSTSIDEVENFWKRISNLEVEKYPIEKLKALSARKLLELEKIDYEDVVKSLGGYDFSIEISK